MYRTGDERQDGMGWVRIGWLVEPHLAGLDRLVLYDELYTACKVGR